MCENWGLEFYSKSHAQRKSNRKCQENRYFDAWFLENSEKSGKIN